MTSKAHPQTPAASFIDDYFLYLLAQASAEISETFHTQLARDGVSVSTWRILSSLYPDKRLNVGALARESLLKQPTLTRALDRLEQAGLISRHHARADRRSVLVSLTVHGQELAAQKIELALAHEKTILQAYSPTEISALKDMLQLLRERSLAIASTS